MTTQQENKIANDWLLNYPQKLEAYQEMVNNFNVIGAMEYSGMPGGTSVGNPCQNKAITLTEIDKYKNWIMVIELVESTLSEKTKEFLRLWRLAEHANKQRVVGRPGWYEEAKNGYAEFFQKRYGKYFLPSNKTLQNWRLKLIDTTVRAAIRKGLL